MHFPTDSLNSSFSPNSFKNSHFETSDLQIDGDYLSLEFDKMLESPGELFFASPEDLKSQGSNILKDLPTYCKEKKFTTVKLMQDLNEGKTAIFRHEINEEENTQTIRCCSEFKLNGEELELRKLDKSGKTTTIRLNKGDYIINTFTPEQRARISQIAFAVIKNSGITSETESKSSIEKKHFKIILQRDEKYKVLKNKFPDMKALRSEQKETDRLQEEIHETEIAAQEKRTKEDKTKKLDEKANKKRKFYQIQDEKSEILKFDKKTFEKRNSE